MITFSFGRNWKRYVKHILNEKILQNAQDSLVRYFGEDFDFTNKVFWILVVVVESFLCAY